MTATTTDTSATTPADLPSDRPVVVVVINQVPDLVYLKVDKRTGELDLLDPARVVHDNDREPIEAALRVKDTHDAHVVAVAVDREHAVDGLREALAMGCDEGVLLSSKATAHSDAVARANLVAQLVRMMPRADCVFVGTETMEPDWSVVGGALAAILEWDLVPGGLDVDLVMDGDTVVGTRGFAMLGADRHRYSSDGPAVVTVRPETMRPRWATTWNVADAYRTKRIHTWNLTDLEIDGRMLARMASLTETRSQHIVRAKKTEPETFTDPPESSARVIGKRLARMGFLGGF